MKINITLVVLLLGLIFGLKGRSQAQAQYVKSSTSAGSKIVRYPEFTVVNTAVNVGVEKSLLPTPDTLYASSVTVGSQYSFILQLNVTTPLVSAGALTLKIKMGTSVLTLANGLSLNGLNTTTPIYITGEIDIKGMGAQIVNARILQWNGVVIPTSTNGMNAQADWTNDMTQQQLFDVTATFTGVTVGTTSYKARIFRRYIEQ